MLGNIVHTGNPIRKGLTKGNKSLGYKNFNFKNIYKTIFLFGGSQGSSYLNNILSQIIKEFKTQISKSSGKLVISSLVNIKSILQIKFMLPLLLIICLKLMQFLI